MRYHRESMIEKEEITVSTKHLGLRIAAFVVVFFIAVAAFTNGVLGISNKKPGYYAIDTEPDEEAPMYAQNVSTNLYFTGESAEIKRSLMEAKGAYSAALQRAKKLTDAKMTYTGFQNIASLNAKPGQTLRVGSELCAMLRSAYEKTKENAGYNVFAGALNAEWETLLYLEEPQPFDPMNDSLQAERIRRLVTETNELSNFTLEFPDSESVCFDMSESYRRLLGELEITAPVLDLGFLRDAYALDLVKTSLEEAGYRQGYMSCGAFTLMLSQEGEGAYCIYGNTADGVLALASLEAAKGSACCEIRSFPFAGESGYYSVEDVPRHDAVDARTGYPGTALSSLYVVDEKGSAAQAAFEALRLFSISAEEWEKLECPLPFACTLPGGGREVYTNTPDRILPSTENISTIVDVR